MSSITFKIDESQKTLLEEVAKSQNISLEDLVNEVIGNYLKQKEQRFQSARVYVRKRYRELYKKLA
ncbi:MAG: DNA-binding protein [Saprospiraceae bacterium]